MHFIFKFVRRRCEANGPYPQDAQMAADLHRCEPQPGNKPAFRSAPPISWPFERQCGKISEFVTLPRIFCFRADPHACE
jgi:hypothetical protein